MPHSLVLILSSLLPLMLVLQLLLLRYNMLLNNLLVPGATTSFIDFNNAKIRSFDSVYQGTKTFIKRNFPIKHGGDPVFKKDFGGNDSTVVDVTNNLVEIPNHFFVTGEKLNYGHLGIGNTMASKFQDTIAGIGSTTILPPEVYAIKLNESQLRFAATAENASRNTNTIDN